MASRGFASALLLLVLLAASACGSSSGSTSRTSAPEELSSGRVDVGGYQLDLATLSSNSLFVQATGGHFVMNDDPQVVLVAIGAVVASARSSEPLPTCERLIEGTDGTCP